MVVFAVYPFAAEMFRQGGIPKRLIPATIALGAFTFTMDALPGTPQIQNIIPTTFFKTDTWAAPWLGVIGALFILVTGLAYLEWRRRQAARGGRRLRHEARQRAEPSPREATEPLARPLAARHRRRDEQGVHPAHPPLLRQHHSATLPGLAKPVVTQVSSVAAIWAVEGALLLGNLTVVAFAFRPLKERFAEGARPRSPAHCSPPPIPRRSTASAQ